MSDEPRGGPLPAVAIGLVAIACCLGPLFIGAAMAGLSGWFAGLTIGGIAASALLAGLMAYGVIRFRKSGKFRAGSRMRNRSVGDPR